MSIVVADCLRCGAKMITFDVVMGIEIESPEFEVAIRCRHCSRMGIMLCMADECAISQAREMVTVPSEYPGAIDQFLAPIRFISLRDENRISPPDFVPKDIAGVFAEATACLTIGCCNAACVMFRLCVDMATTNLLPENNDGGGPNSKERRDLGLRLRWLFNNGKLPPDIHGLADAVRQDGNDGAHVGNLTRADADDLLDFTTILLERLFTEPGQLLAAKERRDKRRGIDAAPA